MRIFYGMIWLFLAVIAAAIVAMGMNEINDLGLFSSTSNETILDDYATEIIERSSTTEDSILIIRSTSTAVGLYFISMGGFTIAAVTETVFEESLRLAIPAIFFFAVLIGGLLITFRRQGEGGAA